MSEIAEQVSVLKKKLNAFKRSVEAVRRLECLKPILDKSTQKGLAQAIEVADFLAVHPDLIAALSGGTGAKKKSAGRSVTVSESEIAEFLAIKDPTKALKHIEQKKWTAAQLKDLAKKHFSHVSLAGKKADIVNRIVMSIRDQWERDFLGTPTLD